MKPLRQYKECYHSFKVAHHRKHPVQTAVDPDSFRFERIKVNKRRDIAWDKIYIEPLNKMRNGSDFYENNPSGTVSWWKDQNNYSSLRSIVFTISKKRSHTVCKNFPAVCKWLRWWWACFKRWISPMRPRSEVSKHLKNARRINPGAYAESFWDKNPRAGIRIHVPGQRIREQHQGKPVTPVQNRSQFCCYT